MKYLKYILFITIIALISCISNKKIEKCKMQKIRKFTSMSKNLYYVDIITNCRTKQSREELVLEELYNKYPSTKNKKIQIQEVYGKLYNEFKYEIKIE